MRVTHCGEEHRIQLSSEEAGALVDACALLLQTLFEQFSSHSV